MVWGSINTLRAMKHLATSVIRMIEAEIGFAQYQDVLPVLKAGDKRKAKYVK